MGRFNPVVPLPVGLEISAVRKSMQFIEDKLSDSDFIDLYFEQANIFSGLVSMFGTKALDSLSNYEKHRHSYTAQQRFPDLSRRGATIPLRPKDCLESKASVRPWALQSHFDHSGWFIIWRYLVDSTGMIEHGKKLLIWRVDVVFLVKDDWKYERSTASSSGGGRTETFGVKCPATRLRNAAVYRREDIVIRGGKPVPINGEETS